MKTVSHSDAGAQGLVAVMEPEYFSEEALKSVYELNRSVLRLLVLSASRSDSEPQHERGVTLAATLSALGTAGREQLARCPIALVDFGFRDIEFWRRIESKQAMLSSSLSVYFPRVQAIQLAQSTLTFAWTLLQSNREAAAITFGLAPECAAALARVGVQALPHLAESYPQCLRPRWETDIGFWHQLIRLARFIDSPAHPRLPAVGLYAMQRQLAELVLLSPHPATPETASTRTNHR